jgi:hypothetical protein
VRRELQKISVQCGPHKNIVFDWFELYTLKCVKPSKAQVLIQSEDISDYIIRNNVRMIMDYIIQTIS